MSSRPETANYAGSEGMNMKWRLIVYGLLAIALALSIELRAYRVDSPDTEMVVIVNPRNPLNPVVRNPYQEEYEKLLYPTVRINSPSGTGSGVVIQTKELKNQETEEPVSSSLRSSVIQFYVITAAHVVGDESEVTVEIYSDTGCTIQDAIVVITDTVRDLALLKPSRDPVARAQLAPESYRPYVFSPIYTVGCSLGLTPRPSAGIISVVESDHWEVTSPILPGNSGGPVFDARTFEVIGIAVWVKVYNGQLITTMGGIVPISEIYEFLEQTPDGYLATGCARK